MTRLVASSDILRTAFREAMEAPGRVMEWPVGINRVGEEQELILQPSADAAHIRRTIRLVLGGSITRPPSIAGDTSALLLVDLDRHRGRTTAYLIQDGVPSGQISGLYLPGPGLHQVSLGSVVASASGPIDRERTTKARFSRSVGALGPAWERITSLRFVIVGVGRTGSLVAGMLIRLGVQTLTLVDFDIIEKSNLGESADYLTEADVGRSKVQAVADHLGSVNPGATIRIAQESIAGLGALEAVKASDFVICTTDHDGARLATTCAASLYARPLLDIGTGLQHDSRIGLTVRLALPGRCLMCLGGLNAGSSWAVMQSLSAERDFHAGRVWTRERRGSLASLNQLAAALGQRMIEDLAQGRLTDSTWLQAEYVEGHVSISYPIVDPTTCPICTTLTGRGDDGLADVPRLISRLKR